MTAFQTLTTNTTSSAYFYADGTNATGLQFNAIGTFGGGTLTLQQKHSDGTWRALVDGVFASNTNKVFDVASQTYVRAVLTDATTPSIFIEFVPMGGR